jgi:hypothetical protein
MTNCSADEQILFLSKSNVHCDIHKHLFWTLASAIHSTHLPATLMEVGGGYWDDRPRGKYFEGEVLTMTN